MPIPFRASAIVWSGVVAIGLAAGFCTVTSAQGQEPEDRQILGDDVLALQGIWESRQKSADGELRFVKAISGNHESFQVFRGRELIANHSADFEVALEGPVKVFRWKNGKRIGGQGAGTLIPDGGCVYRLQQDAWTLVVGALDGEKGPIYPMTYRRLPNGEPDAPDEPK
jgi:hypothetical protein